MRRIVNSEHGLKLILVRPEQAAVDRDICDEFIEFDLQDPLGAIGLFDEFKKRGLRPKGGFVFSDRSMNVGTELLGLLGLTSSSYEFANRALNKYSYRSNEFLLKSSSDPGFYFPRFRSVSCREELDFCIGQMGLPLILKPASEGNNRGVSRISSLDEIESAWNVVSPYASGGIIVEEWIPLEREYSFDGFGHIEFITRKISATGRYPVERGQQVPAILQDQEFDAIKTAGRIANQIVDGHLTAFHNEIKIGRMPMDLKVRAAVVEPNRRPGGMQIWDLAERVYGVNLYREMIRFLIGLAPIRALPSPKGIAAIRMLGPIEDRDWDMSNADTLTLLGDCLPSRTDIEFFDLKSHKSIGNFVRVVPLQNSDFVASFCAFSPRIDEQHLDAIMNQVEQTWLEKLSERKYLRAKAI
jgi:hypothetical protein